jgi:membrane fusion protein, multidrug efflux system
MTSPQTFLTQSTRWVIRGAILLGFAAGVVLLMLWLAGKFSPKVSVNAASAQAETSAIEGQVVTVQLVRLPLSESAIGTIRAVHETTIGSKLLARVVEVNLKAGQKVKAGDILVRLDDTDLRAKLQQAKATVASAEAAHSQAALEENRYGALVKSHAVSQQEYDKTLTALRSTEADLQRARETVNEVQAALDWATVRSPIDGTVIDKKVDTGDMVTPGQMLVTLFDPKRMQLVASVRESLTHKLQVGQSIGVRIDGLNKQCSGTVSEIVPEAQSSSRAFQVKVTGPCPTGIYSGMFGRILIPLEEEQVMVISRQAVRTVGQLELVQAIEKGRTVQRAIRTGRSLGDVKDESGQLLRDQIEVLSGLHQGEQVVLPAGSKPEAAAPNCPVVIPAATPSRETNHD